MGSPAHIERYLQYNILKIYYFVQVLEGPSGTPEGGLHVLWVWQLPWHVVNVSRVMGAIWQWSRCIQHPEKPLFRPLAHACSSILSKVIFSRCDTWYTCLRPRGPPGDGLDRLSDPKNPYFDTSNMSVAQTNQKLASYSSAKYLWFMTGPQGSNRDHRVSQGSQGRPWDHWWGHMMTTDTPEHVNYRLYHDIWAYQKFMVKFMANFERP